ncbi:MAG: Fluoroquinolones export ATP-binding protein [Firmicutes bacterium]|nr:Fluoroquinolones export ATP-binding protein [candidate division NPL-UPA2 bacterium]MBT9154480.1 Fluoroquinolones export ATP-binding protein [candidate division NPL-UPA2 bacterium]MBT9156033.1 Fluoroquinolones export ATP-binding protein [candidate division NPL-UPA2 bacterium]
MITVQGLSHCYKKGGPAAVKDASFEIAKGEVLGFLGPSGAGKSTTQGVLTGLLPLQTGQVNVAGFDMRHPKRELYNLLGVSFEQSNVYAKLTALENLQFYAGLFDVPTEDPMKLLALVGLDHVARKRTGEFSKGMKHRLTFARSLINKPDVWFLDEPTTGLDPAIAHDIKGIIREKNQKGATIFLTTHNMQVADELCHRVAFIVDGEIRLIDSPRNLKLQYGERVVEVEHTADGALKTERMSLSAREDQQRLNHLLEQGTVQTMHTKEATLEEIFIAVTGRGLS